jgi:hypothetical protein
MKRYILIIPGCGDAQTFDADDLETIKAMICLSDNYTVIDTWTGATKNNHKLEIASDLF